MLTAEGNLFATSSSNCVAALLDSTFKRGPQRSQSPTLAPVSPAGLEMNNVVKHVDSLLLYLWVAVVVWKVSQ